MRNDNKPSAQPSQPELTAEKCETCGGSGDPMRVLQDTWFCPSCWADFGTERWKGIGSKLSKEQCT